MRINLKQIEGNKFYPVKEEEVKKAQVDMGILIPKDLLELYSNLGYGFLSSSEYNINRIMDPHSVAEFRNVTGQFEFRDDLDDFNIGAKDKLVFFEANESVYISIGFSKKNLGKIYFYDKEIAKSLEEFFELYIKDEDYYYDIEADK
jgi:hypothetical protein